MSTKSSLSSNYRYTSLKNYISTANTQYALIQAMILSEKNVMTLGRWSYHCQLPKFTSTIHVTV